MGRWNLSIDKFMGSGIPSEQSLVGGTITAYPDEDKMPRKEREPDLSIY
jgi:hypothetical protein